MEKLFALVALSIGAVAASLVACQDLVCGPGTVARNGACVPAEGKQPADLGFCGVGTHYDPVVGGCVANSICDPNTTQPVRDDAGVVVCQGNPLACPTPTAGVPDLVSLCGRLVDTETSAPIATPGCLDLVCDPANPTATGPCSLAVRFYDPIMFMSGAPTRVPGRLQVTDCGRFIAKDVPLAAGVPGIGIGVDDTGSAADTYAFGGLMVPVTPGQSIANLPVYVTAKATDDKWTTSAGQSISFNQQGVLVLIFVYGLMPTSGVTIIRGSAPDATNDFYFGNAHPAQRTTVEVTQTSTGANGTGLVINSPTPTVFTGAGGGLPQGCGWPAAQVGTYPGRTLVLPLPALQANGYPCY